jgi:hypothetical protein
MGITPYLRVANPRLVLEGCSAGGFTRTTSDAEVEVKDDPLLSRSLFYVCTFSCHNSTVWGLKQSTPSSIEGSNSSLIPGDSVETTAMPGGTLSVVTTLAFL